MTATTTVTSTVAMTATAATTGGNDVGDEHQENAKVFKALCDPKRLAILEQLRGGEKCACVLQGPLELTQSGLSYHMKILCDSGLVSSWQEGKWTHYRLSAAGRDHAVALLRRLTTPNAGQDGGRACCGDEA